jgi:hypothetical protein
MKISSIYQQRDLPGKLAHDLTRYGKCGFSLGLRGDGGKHIA